MLPLSWLNSVEVHCPMNLSHPQCRADDWRLSSSFDWTEGQANTSSTPPPFHVQKLLKLAADSSTQATEHHPPLHLKASLGDVERVHDIQRSVLQHLFAVLTLSNDWASPDYDLSAISPRSYSPAYSGKWGSAGMWPMFRLTMLLCKTCTQKSFHFIALHSMKFWLIAMNSKTWASCLQGYLPSIPISSSTVCWKCFMHLLSCFRLKTHSCSHVCFQAVLR